VCKVGAGAFVGVKMPGQSNGGEQGDVLENLIKI